MSDDGTLLWMPLGGDSRQRVRLDPNAASPTDSVYWHLSKLKVDDLGVMSLIHCVPDLNI